MDVKEQHDSHNWQKMVEAWVRYRLFSQTNGTGAPTNSAR